MVVNQFGDFDDGPDLLDLYFGDDRPSLFVNGLYVGLFYAASLLLALYFLQPTRSRLRVLKEPPPGVRMGRQQQQQPSSEQQQQPQAQPQAQPPREQQMTHLLPPGRNGRSRGRFLLGHSASGGAGGGGEQRRDRGGGVEGSRGGGGGGGEKDGGGADAGSEERKLRKVSADSALLVVDVFDGNCSSDGEGPLYYLEEGGKVCISICRDRQVQTGCSCKLKPRDYAVQIRGTIHEILAAQRKKQLQTRKKNALSVSKGVWERRGVWASS